MRIQGSLVFAVLCAILPVPRAAAAGSARLVRDIAVGSQPSALAIQSKAALIGNDVLFGVRTGGSSAELWGSDGTPGGTRLLKAIHGDSLGSGPSPVTALGSRVLFFVDYSELWVSDGTAEGTLRLGRFSGVGPDLVAAGDAVFFVADDGVHGAGLWKTDGTAAGTVEVADVNPAIADEFPYLVTAAGEGVFFVDFETVEYSLWWSDGTAAGTRRVRTFVDEKEAPATLAAGEDGRLYFFTRSQTDSLAFRLWISDATEAGTVALAHFAGDAAGVCPLSCPPPRGPSDLTPFSGGMLFVANDGVHGRQLWRTDGTPGGTTLVRSVAPNGLGDGLQRAGDLVFFGADDGAHGLELWRTDGTEAGTSLVVDAVPGPEPGTNCCGIGSGALGSRIYYGAPGGELWSSDGTPGGTARVASLGDISLYARDFVGASDALFFYALGSTSGFELWKTDGTESGTSRLDRVSANAASDPRFLVDADGRLYFDVQEDGQYRSLYSTDGTEAGTQSVARFAAIGPASFATTSPSLPLGRSLYFTADDGVRGYELWTSDGTSAGTRLVKDVYPGLQDSAASFLGVVEDRVLFAASSPGRYGLWVTDGTGAGTQPIGAASVVAESSGVVLGGRLLFSGSDPDHGGELWSSDGTDAGTFLVKDINPGPGFSYIYSFAGAGGRFYFSAYDGAWGLWKTDGTSAGTERVAVVGEAFGPVWAAGSLVYFTTQAGLWRSDGTAAGTSQIFAGSNWGQTPVGTNLFFIQGYGGPHTWELWKTDGTVAGTMRVAAPQAGTSELAAAGDRVVFQADDGQHGVELWVSDGTPAGTGMVQDIAPGPRSSLPGRFLVSGADLYFVADDGVTGTELWTIPVEALRPGPSRELDPAPRPAQATRVLERQP